MHHQKAVASEVQRVRLTDVRIYYRRLHPSGKQEEEWLLPQKKAALYSVRCAPQKITLVRTREFLL